MTFVLRLSPAAIDSDTATSFAHTQDNKEPTVQCYRRTTKSHPGSVKTGQQRAPRAVLPQETSKPDKKGSEESRRKKRKSVSTGK